MQDDHQFESPEFRQHIRALLYEYSVKHYTTDYIAFTEGLVSELLQDLRPVPLTDPYSFVIPVDPFQTFSQIHALSSLPPYDEILQITNEARLYLKHVMHSVRGVAKTSRLEWTEPSYAHITEPYPPALTRHSRKETPRLGKDSSEPSKFSALAKFHKLETVTVEPIEEEKLDFEGIMKVKHQINPSELSAVQTVLKKTADTMRYMPTYKNKNLDPEFLCQIDCKPPEVPNEQFMPIFPRSRLHGTGATNGLCPLPDMKSFAQLPSALDTKINLEDADGDLSLQNLVVVSGWQAIQSFPPSTASSRESDSEDQEDQLYFSSSPDTEPPLVEDIEKTKMEVLIPRSRQIGGASGIAPHILAGKTLQSFLQPLLISTKKEQDQRPNLEANDTAQKSLIMSPTSSSIVGQAGSEIGHFDSQNCATTHDEDCPLEDEIKKLYPGTRWDETILNEPLNDKRDLLMEVPTLQEPNVHPPGDMDIPKSYSGFLVPPPASQKQESNPAFIKPEPAFQFLKKAKGKQALSLALSWIPFTVDKRLPSVVELVGVAELFGPNRTQNGDQFLHDVTEAEKLIKCFEMSQDDGRRFSWTLQTNYRPTVPPEEFRLLLNRQERQRAANSRLSPHETDIDHVERMEICKSSQSRGLTPHDKSEERPTLGIDHDSLLPNHPAKRQHDFSIGDDDDLVERDGRNSKRPRLEVDYESSPSENVNPLLPAYDEIEYGRSDSGYHSPGPFFVEDNKENWPPLSLSSHAMEDEYFQGQPQYDHVMGEDYAPDDGGSFEPLSFESQYLPSGSANDKQGVEYDDETTCPQKHTNLKQFDISKDTLMNAPEEFLFEPDIASRSLGISAFAQLRARKVSAPSPAALPVSVPVPVPANITYDPFRGAPEEILDKDTIVVPGPISAGLPVHRYMASLDLIQKHGLVRALRSEECAVELIERQTLGGVDLIIDPRCAVLFISLFTLPAQCAADVERVSKQSWKFSRLLVVFEAYPESYSKKYNAHIGRDGSVSELYAYTPPILKAIKKFRRDINIADACGTKKSGTRIQYSFADSVHDAALVTRLFGCQAEERDDTFGVIWGERPWLNADFIESEEQMLAGLNGMNHFSASMILSQITLEEYIQLVPAERLLICSGLISEEALEECSADIESRLVSHAGNVADPSVTF